MLEVLRKKLQLFGLISFALHNLKLEGGIQVQVHVACKFYYEIKQVETLASIIRLNTKVVLTTIQQVRRTIATIGPL